MGLSGYAVPTFPCSWYTELAVFILLQSPPLPTERTGPASLTYVTRWLFRQLILSLHLVEAPWKTLWSSLENWGPGSGNQKEFQVAPHNYRGGRCRVGIQSPGACSVDFLWYHASACLNGSEFIIVPDFSWQVLKARLFCVGKSVFKRGGDITSWLKAGLSDLTWVLNFYSLPTMLLSGEPLNRSEPRFSHP